jgi:hypothetical protein
LSSEHQGKEQDKDPGLRLIRDWLKKKMNPSLEELARQASEVKILWAHRDLLEIKDDVLLYKWQSPPERHLCVVPTHQRLQMRMLAHDNVTAGHLGIEKTKERLRQVCFWTS